MTHHLLDTGGPPHAAPALAIDGVTAGYRGTVVLRNVSLSVPPASVVALLGPNGAGKSTLLRTVSGLIAPTSGTILLHGEDITRAPAHVRAAKGLCHIPEGRGVFRQLTVRENLRLQSHPGAEDHSLERAISAFPVLGERLGQRAATLSGGQQQMLAVAAAYIRDPSLILVDEASLGLAPIIVDEIFDFLHQRAEAGAAILLIDQFAARALDMATKAYVLRKGEIAFAGGVDELRSSSLFDHYLGTATG